MKVIGTGWRYWAMSDLNLDAMYEFMDSLLDLVLRTTDPYLQLVLGGGHDEDQYTHGADRALMLWARDKQEHYGHLTVPDPLVHKAQWTAYGKAAGPMRNAEMIIGGADLVVAFPHEESKGTTDLLAKAKRANIPRLVVPWLHDPDFNEMKVVETHDPGLPVSILPKAA